MLQVPMSKSIFMFSVGSVAEADFASDLPSA